MLAAESGKSELPHARSRPDPAETTALVHEAYLKLVKQSGVNWQNRSHFFAIAAQAMRRILIDNARRRGAAKRASGQAVPLDEGRVGPYQSDQRLLALDEALSEL